MTRSKNRRGRPTLKMRFFKAVRQGALGRVSEQGEVVVTLDEFREYFSDITSDYVNSFLPAATIEPGRTQMTRTKYVFRSPKGVYRVHPDVFKT